MIAININVTMRGRWTHCKPPENQFCIRRRKKHRYYPNGMFYWSHCKNSVAVENCGKLWISGEHSVSFSFHKSHDWFYHTHKQTCKKAHSLTHSILYSPLSLTSTEVIVVYMHIFSLSLITCHTFIDSNGLCVRHFSTTNSAHKPIEGTRHSVDR